MKQIISKNRVVIGFVFLAVMPLMFSCVRQKDFGVIELTPFKEGICNTVEWLKAVVVNE